MPRKYRTLILAGLLTLSAPPAGAQVVRGTVVEAEVGVSAEGVETDRPIAGAQVELLTGRGGEETWAVTDSLGSFHLSAPRGGAFRLRVSHPEYLTYEAESIEVGEAETVSIEIRLGRNVIPLEPLVVRARTNNTMAAFHERRTTGAFATFLTREEIDARAAGRATDLLRGLPGVRISFERWGVGPKIEMQGGFGVCEPTIFVDGVRAPQSTESSLDDYLSPERIEGVEVYSSFSTVPTQFLSGMCGVILFWTRPGGREGGEPWGWKRMLLGFGIAVGLILWIR
ncbi:MAG: Plug and carboxypeptidase regulatory-like domain-containing protein [Longimicrobiales bacterium]|nr:Plug and carboxypeptidase regulatory-like domain-containing protein [Longimicrobiales bacterium]